MNGQRLVDERDRELEKRLQHLETRLQIQLHGRVRDLNLHIGECGVVLRGFSRTYYAKQLAQHMLMQEGDIPISSNDIGVV